MVKRGAYCTTRYHYNQPWLTRTMDSLDLDPIRLCRGVCPMCVAFCKTSTEVSDVSGIEYFGFDHAILACGIPRYIIPPPLPRHAHSIPQPLAHIPPPLLRGEIYLKFRGYNGSKVLVAARSRHPRLICITIGMISVLEC